MNTILSPAVTTASTCSVNGVYVAGRLEKFGVDDSKPSLVYYETGNYDTNGNPIHAAYSNDTTTYRLAKFRNEISNYMELHSALFYYLFTELFLITDNRAKNCFQSFIGSKAGV